MNLGKRGEGYVIIQFALIALVVLAPRMNQASAIPMSLRMLGGYLLATGLLIGVLAVIRLGQNLTALPHPKEDSSLITSGIYGLVRHPIYSSVILLAFGWASWNASLLTLFLAFVLLGFFDIKARREEFYLQQKFVAYANYKRRVKKFIPFVY
jgi:protein-S-isoprenylcysteine O-methyltransferase Ste14